MALFTSAQLKERAVSEISKGAVESRFSSVPRGTRIQNKLLESITEQKNHSSFKTYDIFLSHSSKDAEMVEGLKLTLEDFGYTVYVDWLEDPQLDRSNVTKETAKMLQKRMKQSRSLIYAYSENGSASRWMPWELGYFDGLKGLAAVLPIVDQSGSDRYTGTEFLGIYNYAVYGSSYLYVHESTYKYVPYASWLAGKKP